MSAMADVIGTPRASSAARLVTLLGRFREAGLLVVLAVLFLGVSLREPCFASASNIRQILLSIAIIAIVASRARRRRRHPDRRVAGRGQWSPRHVRSGPGHRGDARHAVHPSGDHLRHRRWRDADGPRCARRFQAAGGEAPVGNPGADHRRGRARSRRRLPAPDDAHGPPALRDREQPGGGSAGRHPGRPARLRRLRHLRRALRRRRHLVGLPLRLDRRQRRPRARAQRDRGRPARRGQHLRRPRDDDRRRPLPGRGRHAPPGPRPQLAERGGAEHRDRESARALGPGSESRPAGNRCPCLRSPGRSSHNRPRVSRPVAREFSHERRSKVSFFVPRTPNSVPKGEIA